MIANLLLQNKRIWLKFIPDHSRKCCFALPKQSISIAGLQKMACPPSLKNPMVCHYCPYQKEPLDGYTPSKNTPIHGLYPFYMFTVGTWWSRFWSSHAQYLHWPTVNTPITEDWWSRNTLDRCLDCMNWMSSWIWAAVKLSSTKGKKTLTGVDPKNHAGWAIGWGHGFRFESHVPIQEVIPQEHKKPNCKLWRFRSHHPLSSS